ncbi:RING finger protein 10 isoform X2 [Phalaenopsis equestris]|uniref:RING finger protein 10 isoform X2 n=1 Tax=Phalaenopsis equestris TaxID=78828 RepID=UPI0009E5F14D|nr:RING finger protein 10 isoform X2 [Phalaenopsis equestris]
MSISPTAAQRYVSNPSRDTEQNPRAGYGILPSQQDGCPFGPRTNGSLSISAGSAQDSATRPPHGRPFEMSGENHGTFKDTSGAKNVRELKSSNARKHSNGENRSTYPQHQSIGQSGSSQFRSNKLEPNGRLAATLSVPRSDNRPLDSSDIQITANHASSRRRELLNANHLLNFHYDPVPRSHQQKRIPLPRRHQRVKSYNKDLFLQANYKFIIYDSGRYSIESMNPDKMFPWEDVVCVRYSAPFPVQCPICLESPLCPQITSCGHIYCFPCILRYLLMGAEEHKGESWKKCPLCFSMISSGELYTIKIDNVKQFRVGDHADFVLLARAKDSQIPFLKSQDGAHIMTSNSINTTDLFSKFILSSDVEMSVRDAKTDLTDWLCKAEAGIVDELEKLPYVCVALEQLEERMRKWMEDRVLNESSSQLNRCALSSSPKVRHHINSLSPCSLNSNLDAENAHSKELVVTSLENGRIHEKLEHSENVSGASHPDTTVGSSELPYDECKVLHKDSNICKDFKERESYTFYQALDGQTLILHPLCMKCLLHHYGSYDMLPPRINGVILELEMITQSEAMRKRYRYLSHFSLSTTFQLCEIELAEILPPASLAPFMGEIKKREKQRKWLAKKERDEKVRAEAANCAEVASLREMLNPSNQRYLSDKDTIFSLDEFKALGSGVAPTTNLSLNNTRKLFSNVTRLGFASAYDSPALRAEELANSSGSMDATQEASVTQDGSASTIPPSFANVLASTKCEGGPQNSNSSARKGKKPIRVLLSTAGGRRY